MLSHLRMRGDFWLGAKQELSPNECRLLLQLKLHESVPNGFDFCEALIPFTRRFAIPCWRHSLGFALYWCHRIYVG